MAFIPKITGHTNIRLLYMHPQKPPRVNALHRYQRAGALCCFFSHLNPQRPSAAKANSRQQPAWKKKDMDRIWPDTLWGASHTRTHTLNPASWCLRLPCWSQKRFFKFYAFLTPLCFHIHTVTGNSLSSCCLHAQRGIRRDKSSVYGLLLCFLQPCVVCWCKRSLIEMIKEKRCDALIIIHQAFNCEWHGSCIRESFKPDHNCF